MKVVLWAVLSIIICYITGIIYGGISSFIDIIPLFQLTVAAIIYGSVSFVTKRIKNRIIAIFFVLFLSAVVYNSALSSGLFFLNTEIETSILTESGLDKDKITNEQEMEINKLVKETSDEYLFRQTGHTEKLGYAIYVAKSGSFFKNGKIHSTESLPIVGYLFELIKIMIIFIAPAYIVSNDFKKINVKAEE